MLEFLQRPGKDGCGGGGEEMESDSDIIIEDVCEQGM